MTGPSQNRIAHWVRWQGLPALEYLIYQSPLWSKWTKQSSLWAEEALNRLSIRENGMRNELSSHQQNYEHRDLLQKYIDASRKHPEISHDTLSLMTTSTISAGFDSTSTTITAILYLLIRHPDVLRTLTKELEQAHLSVPTPRWKEVNKLEYLDAVFKETIRYNPFITIPLERVVPVGDTTISGKRIPEGTIVGCAAKVIHRNRELFGHDVNQFCPERWLATPEKRVAMERALMGFGAGKRICMGRHIAELEIKKIIPAIVLHFKVCIQYLPHCDCILAQVAQFRWTLWIKTQTWTMRMA